LFTFILSNAFEFFDFNGLDHRHQRPLASTKAGGSNNDETWKWYVLENENHHKKFKHHH
jgi:hypothetical protein